MPIAIAALVGCGDVAREQANNGGRGAETLEQAVEHSGPAIGEPQATSAAAVSPSAASASSSSSPAASPRAGADSSASGASAAAASPRTQAQQPVQPGTSAAASPTPAPQPVNFPGDGPLRVHPDNPRYFTDNRGQAIYLTGSHTWTNLQTHEGVPPVPYDAYLDFLEAHNHNFARLWRWEHARMDYDGIMLTVQPQPWQRTGPGTALDGQPKFDLSAFDQTYFDNLRARAVAAAERGIYVSIMLFEGHALNYSQPPWNWDGHPFHPGNNINQLGVERDTLHTLDVPAGVEVQKAFIRKVIDTVNDLDNVLYEIANEDGHGTVEWQYHLIDYIKAYERSKPKQHPVGMTFRYNGGTNDELFASPADWISPGTSDYAEPAANNSGKVVILDTDHIWGIGGDSNWVWKSFVRGNNPIYMDPFGSPHNPAADPTAQRAMGQTLAYARRLDLAAMEPRPELASSTYALASIGKANDTYLVYSAGKPEVTVDLSSTAGELSAEWFDPQTGKTVDGGSVAGGGVQSFAAPFESSAVLYLVAK